MSRSTNLFRHTLGFLLAGSTAGIAQAGEIQRPAGPEVAAQEFADSLREARNTLPDVERAALDRLAELHGQNIFVRLNEGRSIRMLVGPDLAPARCPSSPLSLKSPKAYESFGRCFVAELGTLAGEGLRAVNSESLRLERALPGVDGGEQIVLIQEHEGLPIKPGKVKFYFRRGKLLNYVATLSDTSEFPLRAPLPDAGLEVLAAGFAGEPHLVEVERYFDVKAQRFVVEYDGSKDRVALDETTGELIEHKARAAYFVDEVTKSKQVALYDVDFTPAASPVAANVTFTRTCIGSCNFTQICDWNAALLADSFSHDYITATFLGTAAVAPSFNDLSSCSGTPFSHVTNDAVGTDRWYLVNAYYQLTRFADMKKHALGYLSGGNSYDMRLKFQTDGSGDIDGSYTQSNHQLTFYVDAEETMGNLHIMGHEYGHYIHDMFGWDGTGAVSEGWADTVPLRFVLWDKNANSGFSAVNYSTDMNGYMFNYRTSETIVNGEYLPNGSEYQYYPDPVKCANENSGDITQYECGSLMSRIYWELAWDQCRVRFGACNNLQDIIASGTYANEAWKLASITFAHAIANMPAGGDIADFFDLVIAKYWEYSPGSLSTIDWNDYQRVGNVLSRHCVGWSDHCWGEAGYPTLPGSKLPSADTKKVSLFKEAETTTTLTPTAWSDASGGFGVTIAPNQTLSLPFSITTTRNYVTRIVARTTHLSTVNLHVSTSPTNGIFWNVSSSPFAWTWRDSGLLNMPSGAQTVSIKNVGTNSIRVDAVLLE